MGAAQPVGQPPLRVNVGCGDHRIPGWINVDSTLTVQPTLVADAVHLPLADRSVDRCYLGHVLEHLSYPDGVVAAVREAVRVADQVAVVVPDMDRARVWVERGWEAPELVERIRGGEGRWPGDHHLWVPTAAGLCHALHLAGVDYHLVDVGWLLVEGWPVASGMGWQVAAYVCP